MQFDTQWLQLDYSNCENTKINTECSIRFHDLPENGHRDMAVGATLKLRCMRDNLVEGQIAANIGAISLRYFLIGTACLAASLFLSGCADIPLGDLDSLKNYQTPDAPPQQSTYEGVSPTRNVDSNGNCNTQTC